MAKKLISLLLAALTVCCFFTACGGSDGEKAYVDSVGVITGMGYSGLNSRYSGIVVSQSTQTINKEKDKKVLQLKVSVGDKVEAGDVLFTYDVQAVELSLKKLKLERDQLEKSLTLIAKDIEKYEKKVAKASEANKLSYEVQLQTYQIDEKEKTVELNTKVAEIEKAEKMLSNSDVVSEVTGVVQSINEQNAGETDENGKVIPYMTIIETGAYRIKGTISEMDINGLREGAAVVIHSRVDDTSWTGVVESIEWDNPEKNNNEMYYYSGMDSENTASKYPFYVRLDSTDGLIMGQHVYIEMGGDAAGGMMLPEYYICEADGDAWVWAADKRERLEKRRVTLGEYDPDMCCYEILDGLTVEDYIAFPDETLREGQGVIMYEEPDYVDGDMGMIEGDMDMYEGDMGMFEGDFAVMDDTFALEEME